MSSQRAQFVASVVEDERQLDGSWHLELVGEAEESSMELALRLVLDREGVVDEGELILSHNDVDQSGEIEAGASADELDPLDVQLAAVVSERAASLIVTQRDDGDFDVILQFATPP